MVNPYTDRRLTRRFAIALCVLFFLAGQAFLPRLGVQNDEALFGYAFFQPRTGFTVHIGHSNLPLMLMSYLGTLKAWVYRPIFAAFGTGVWSLREPMLLAGAASVWLFFLLLRRIAGDRAAIIGCALLAADAMYLLTVCFDWGPVALQHLLLIGGALLLVRFYQEGTAGPLAGGFFLWGLAMWDKALAIWMLGGLAAAALAIFPRQIWRVTTFRRAALSVLFFALGALPLIVYNAKTNFATFRGQDYSVRNIGGKAQLLMETARGAALLGWLVDEDWQTPKPHAAQGVLEKTSLMLSRLAGRPRQSLLFYAFVLAVLLAPLARGPDRRIILFALIAMAVQWAQMAIAANGGGSVHHTILLWPLPTLVIAVSFAAASRRLGRAARPVLAAVVAVLMLSGGLVLNEYYRLAWQNGGAANWTAAVFTLSDYAGRSGAPRIYCADWGILDTLRVLNRGTLPLDLVYDKIDDAPRLREAVGNPEHLFLGHAKGFEFFEGADQKLVDAASRFGYRQEMLQTVWDNYGRPTYEVYRFVAQ